MQTLTTYQFTRGITRALQSVRDGEDTIVTCEGKAPILLHRYTGRPCAPPPTLCANCQEPADTTVEAPGGAIPLCSPCLERARLLSIDP